MFSILNFFSSSKKFFDLLDQSAERLNSIIAELSEILKSDKQVIALQRFIDLEQEDQKITEDIRDLLVQTFVTGLEREDIEALANAILRTVKTVHKFAERYKSGLAYTDPNFFDAQLKCINHATTFLVEMVKSLRNAPDLVLIKKLKDEIDQQELLADDLMFKLIAYLYTLKDPIKLIILKDLCDLLEKVIDRCRDAGNLVYNITLKNS